MTVDLLQTIQTRLIRRFRVAGTEDEPIVRSIVEEQWRAIQAGRQTQLGSTPATQIDVPVTSTFGMQQHGRYLYNTIVVIRDNTTGSEERKPARIYSDRPLSIYELREDIDRRIQIGAINVVVLGRKIDTNPWELEHGQPVAPGEGQPSGGIRVDVVVISVERG